MDLRTISQPQIKSDQRPASAGGAGLCQDYFQHRRGLLTSTGNVVERGKEYSEDLYNHAAASGRGAEIQPEHFRSLNDVLS